MAHDKLVTDETCVPVKLTPLGADGAEWHAALALAKAVEQPDTETIGTTETQRPTKRQKGPQHETGSSLMAIVEVQVAETSVVTATVSAPRDDNGNETEVLDTNKCRATTVPTRHHLHTVCPPHATMPTLAPGAHPTHATMRIRLHTVCPTHAAMPTLSHD